MIVGGWGEPQQAQQNSGVEHLERAGIEALLEPR